MAWTAPRDWTTGEIVTEVMFDTHVRDNFNYLKGNAGAVDIASEITFTNSTGRQITVIHSGGNVKSFIGQTSAGIAQYDVNRDPVAGTFTDTAKSHAKINVDGSGTSSLIGFDTAAAANTQATRRATITGDGNFGVGLTAAVGKLQAYGGNGGFMFYDNSATFSSPVTIIPNATGDVLYRMYIIGVARCTNGPASTAITGVSLTPGGGAGNIASLNAAADVLQMTVAADGSTTISRSAGTSTWAVSLVIMWV